MVRNAVDHGIETPAVRQERGKSPEGTLSLHAFHESSKVIIEVHDDGGGIDPQRVRDKAIRIKAITSEQAARMNDGRLPFFVLAWRVNWLTTRIPPLTS